jgi:hypothetical protein
MTLLLNPALVNCMIQYLEFGNFSQEIAIFDSSETVEIGVVTITLTPCCEYFSVIYYRPIIAEY